MSTYNISKSTASKSTVSKLKVSGFSLVALCRCVDQHFTNAFAVLSVCAILFAAPLTSMAETTSMAEADVNTESEEVMAKVNLNEADAATLAAMLKGVGLKKAEAIVAWRQANGQFVTINQLTEVKGIGKSILEKNREKLTL